MEFFAESVPRVIYSMWLQGRNCAPDLVKLNFDRWTELNPDYELVVLDREDAHEMLQPWIPFLHELSPQALSDIVRIRLLLDNGGIWADASVFAVKPLDPWLETVSQGTGFFAFERPGPDRPISSWFLASTKQNNVVSALWDEIERFWSKPRRLIELTPDDPAIFVSPGAADESDTYPYFWLHYLFQYILETNRKAAATWAQCIKISADGPHALQQEFIVNSGATAMEIRRAAQNAPVQKLNWRISYPLDVLSDLT